MCPIRHNSFSVKHLSCVALRRDWLCFTRLGLSASALATLPALAHGSPPTGNWLCLARFAPTARAWATLPALGPCYPPAANWLRLARLRSEYRAGADRTGLPRSKAVLGPQTRSVAFGNPVRTVQDRLWDRCSSGASLRRGRGPGRSRRNPPKSWSLISHSLFYCPTNIQVYRFNVK
jgi:hypothetical protein